MFYSLSFLIVETTKLRNYGLRASWRVVRVALTAYHLWLTNRKDRYHIMLLGSNISQLHV